MAMGLIQPLTETNIYSGVKAAFPPSCADCLEIWEPQPSETLRSCPGL